MVTLACGIPSSVMNVRGTGGNGEGKDIWTLPFDMITRFGVFFYTLEILYFAQVMLLKMTLLLFYLQIFPGPARRLLWATVVVNGIFGVSFMLLATFQCTPISFFWTNWDGEHKGKWYVEAACHYFFYAFGPSPANRETVSTVTPSDGQTQQSVSPWMFG